MPASGGTAKTAAASKRLEAPAIFDARQHLHEFQHVIHQPMLHEPHTLHLELESCLEPGVFEPVVIVYDCGDFAKPMKKAREAAVLLTSVNGALRTAWQGGGKMAGGSTRLARDGVLDSSYSAVRLLPQERKVRGRF